MVRRHLLTHSQVKKDTPTPHPSHSMEGHPSLVKPLGAVSNSEMRRQFSAPAMFKGSDVSPQILRRPSAREWVTCTNGRGDRRLQQEARELFDRERSRLVEKPGATTTTTTTTPTPRPGMPQETVTWAERGGGEGGLHHTHYLRRLVDLRDDLISQEETALAKAVDRLRLHSVTHRDVARYRLKLKDPGAGEGPSRVGGLAPSGGPGPSPRPLMMTTVEKFRQMRPHRPEPVLFPLQGTQLFESTSSSGPVFSGSTSGGSRVDSPKSSMADTSTSVPPGVAQPQRVVVGAGVEETGHLQRLFYPSSSIPNIGRKALPRPQVSLELRSSTQPLQQLRHRLHVHRSPRPGLVAPFRLRHHPHGPQEGAGGGGGEGGGRSGGGESSVHGSDSRAAAEYASSPSPPPPPPLPRAHRIETMVDGDRLDMEKLNQYFYVYCLPDVSLEEEEGKALSPLPPAAYKGRTPRDGPIHPVRAHWERTFDPERTGLGRPFSDRTGLGNVGSDTVTDTHPNPNPKRTVGMLTGPDRITLPVIHTSSESRSPAHHGQARAEAFGANDTEAFSSPELSIERRKRHIVIDMPNILFSSATPDVTREPTQAEVESHSECPGALDKTLTHNEECRHKELATLPVHDP
ncbi:uncharacterized protein LOC143281967 isoform X2 [Babylonia areolata]|uniref:uncharacterized protein LOC143281967 isoform X2 n=1 Tax=Babylonia areolata TaxID=304850 RepID=UPI003FD68AFB